MKRLAAQLAHLDGYKLCYITYDEGANGTRWAFFSNVENLDQQEGDDWDDAPWEYNAEPPHEWREGSDTPEYQICRLAFDGPFWPITQDNAGNPLSVHDINSGQTPWLLWHGHPEAFWAGMSPLAFAKEVVKSSEGRIWLEHER